MVSQNTKYALHLLFVCGQVLLCSHQSHSCNGLSSILDTCETLLLLPIKYRHLQKAYRRTGAWAVQERSTIRWWLNKTMYRAVKIIKYESSGVWWPALSLLKLSDCWLWRAVPYSDCVWEEGPLEDESCTVCYQKLHVMASHWYGWCQWCQDACWDVHKVIDDCLGSAFLKSRALELL